MGRIAIVLCALSISLLFASVDGCSCRKRPWQQLLDMRRERMGLGVLRCYYWCDSWSPEIGYERDGTPCEVDFGYGACFMGRCVPGIMRRSSLPLPYSPFDGYYGGGSSVWVPMSIGYDRPPRAPEVRSGYGRPHLPFGPPVAGFERVTPWRLARLHVIYDLTSDFQRSAQVLPGSFRAVLPKLVPYGPSGGMPSTGPSPKVPSRPTKKGRSTSPNVGSSAEGMTTTLLKDYPLAPFNVPSRPAKKGRSTSPNVGRSAEGMTTTLLKDYPLKKPKVRIAPFNVPSRPAKKGRSTSPNVGSSAKGMTTTLLKDYPLQKPEVRIAPFNVPSRPAKKGRSTSPNVGTSTKGKTTQLLKPRVTATAARPRTAPIKGPDESSISSGIDYA